MKEAVKKRVVVAMSGGVDSSAAALLLKRQGFDVIGISMKLWAGEGGKRKCCSLEDFQDARRVSDILDIPYYVVNMEQAFSDRVIDNFTHHYLKGETPNPCILCNQEMKFDLLLKKAHDLGAEYLATGHYAKIVLDNEKKRRFLFKGKDQEKDQTYFLFSMTQTQLAQVLFPLGNMCKPEVRELLRKEGITIAEKEESQDICFIDDKGYASFISERIEEKDIKKGSIISENGDILGEHDGIHRFTIGQRRGLGISSLTRLYVVGVDHKNNNVIVGERDALLSKGLTAVNVTWISIASSDFKPGKTLRASVKIRYSQDEHPATIYTQGDKVRVEFDSPQMAVTPGQAAVFYNGDEVMGGGWIEGAID